MANVNDNCPAITGTENIISHFTSNSRKGACLKHEFTPNNMADLGLATPQAKQPLLSIYTPVCNQITQHSKLISSLSLYKSAQQLIHENLRSERNSHFLFVISQLIFILYKLPLPNQRRLTLSWLGSAQNSLILLNSLTLQSDCLRGNPTAVVT